MLKLATKKIPKPCPQLIERLEKLLEDAKAGEIQSIVFTIAYSNGATGNGWSMNDSSVMTMLGEMKVAELEFVHTFIDTRSWGDW